MFQNGIPHGMGIAEFVFAALQNYLTTMFVHCIPLFISFAFITKGIMNFVLASLGFQEEKVLRFQTKHRKAKIYLWLFVV